MGMSASIKSSGVKKGSIAGTAKNFPVEYGKIGIFGVGNKSGVRIGKTRIASAVSKIRASTTRAFKPTRVTTNIHA